MIWKVLVAIESDNPVSAADAVQRGLERIKAPLFAVLKVTDEHGRIAWRPANPRRRRLG